MKCMKNAVMEILQIIMNDYILPVQKSTDIPE